MYYAELAPAPRLAGHVLSHWCFEALLPPGEVFDHHVWPDGCVSIVVAYQPQAPVTVSVIGPTVEAHRVPVPAGSRYVGSRFWPDAGGRVLGCATAKLRDRVMPAAQLLGETASLCAAVTKALDTKNLRDPQNLQDVATTLDAWLAPRVAAAPLPDPRARAVVRAIVAAPDTAMSTLAANAGMSMRQLQRVFRGAVGVTPKEYARIRRVRSGIVLASRGDTRWARLAAELGFSDQSHLIRELTQITGFSPSDLRRQLAQIDHGPVDP